MGNIQNKKISSSSNVLSSSPSSVQKQQQQESILTKNNLKIQHSQQQQKEVSLNKSINDIVQQNNTNNSNLNYTQHFSFFHLSTSRSFKNYSQSRNNSRKINKSNPTINKSTPAAETELAKLSKTYWPIPYLEAIFLPHFQINRQSLKNQYNIEQLLAKGAYGNVYKVIDCKNHNEYAVKVLNKAQIIKDIGVEQLKNEVDIQKTCGHHPFIVQGLSVWQTHRNIYLLSEYVSGGELFENISHFTYELIQIFVAEIALALDFLHNAGVIYRDLKPENILLDEKYHIQLIDFGFSKWLKIGNTTRTICGTLQYMAPEILRGETYGHAVDWWALGVIVYRMVTNEFPNTTKLLLKRYENKDKKNIDANAINNNNKEEVETKDNGNDDADNDDGQHQMEMLNNESHELLISYDKNQFNNKNDINALNDLIKRLLEFNAKKRIHSVMALKRIAIYKNYNFDNVQKKKVSPKDLITKNYAASSSNI